MVIIVAILLTSCSLIKTGYPDSDELVEQLGISHEYFSNLPTCEQVRLYSYLGPYFPGARRHEIVSYPWMTEIFYNKGQIVAQCIIDEALLRQSQAHEMNNPWRLVALNDLIEKMQFGHLASAGRAGADFNLPEGLDYLQRVVCKTSDSYEPEATRAYYMLKLHSFPHLDLPQESHTSIGIQKMKSMICK